MVLVQNYALAVFLCAVAMICWGSWQNRYRANRLKCQYGLKEDQLLLLCGGYLSGKSLKTLQKEQICS